MFEKVVRNGTFIRHTRVFTIFLIFSRPRDIGSYFGFTDIIFESVPYPCR